MCVCVCEPVLPSLGKRKDIDPLHPQGTTHRAVAACAERSLHCGTSRGVQAQDNLLGGGHGVAGHCEIHPDIMNMVEHAENPIVVLCLPPPIARLSAMLTAPVALLTVSPPALP